MSDGYPSDWDTRRRDVYERDNYTCQNCGREGGPIGDAELHAHHIVPKGKGGTHKKSNLKTICKNCHDAIHGDSIAPTSTDENSSVDLEFPLSTDEYPYSVSTQLECLNLVFSISESLERISEDSSKFGKYANMHQSIDAGDEPDRLQSKYSEARGDIQNTMNDLESDLHSIQNISTPVYNHFKSTQEKYEEVVDISAELLSVLEDYRDAILSVSKEEVEGEALFIELQIITDEMEQTVNRYNDAAEELADYLYQEISSELDRIEKNTSSVASSISLSGCPICDGELGELRFDIGGNDATLIRCPDCRTEWTVSLGEMEIIYSDYDLEGVAMPPGVWSEGHKQGYRLPDDLDTYQYINERYKAETNKTLVVFGVLEAMIIIWSYNAGSILQFIVLTAIAFLLSRYLFKNSASKNLQLDSESDIDSTK